MISATPQPGQPLDLQYISELAQSVIDLNSAVTNKTYSKSFIKNKTDATPKIDRTSNISFYAAYIPIVNNKTIQPGQIETFVHTFSSSFSQTPVVTMTAVNNENSVIGQNVSIVITSIEPGKVSGLVKFNNTITGDTSLGVNLIAVGFQGPTVS